MSDGGEHPTLQTHPDGSTVTFPIGVPTKNITIRTPTRTVVRYAEAEQTYYLEEPREELRIEDEQAFLLQIDEHGSERSWTYKVVKGDGS